MTHYTHKELTLRHYKTYMKIYGFMLVYLAEDDTEVMKAMDNVELDSVLMAIRERIEESKVHEMHLHDLIVCSDLK